MPIPAPPPLPPPPPSSSPVPHTPKAKAIKLDIPIEGLSLPEKISIGARVGHMEKVKLDRLSNEEVTRDDDVDIDNEGDMDGRLTPMPDSSSNRSSLTNLTTPSQRSSSPSPPTSLSSDPVAPDSTAASDRAQVLDNLAPAEVGLCALRDEIQLRNALLSKDRLFLLVIAREVESFLALLKTSGASAAAVQMIPGGAGGSLAATLGPSFQLGSTPGSKFQRMLVYKTAEWYGLKACPGAEEKMVVGVQGNLSEKAHSLRLAEMVPKPPSPTQKFKIMQRANDNVNDGHRGSSTEFSAESSAQAQAMKKKTLEERELAYALARQRIYGSGSDPSKTGISNANGGGNEINGSVKQGMDDEFDPVPRHLYAGEPSSPYNASGEPVYASIFHPVKSESQPVPQRQAPQQAYAGYMYHPNQHPTQFVYCPPRTIGPQGYPDESGYPTPQMAPMGPIPYGPSAQYSEGSSTYIGPSTQPQYAPSDWPTQPPSQYHNHAPPHPMIPEHMAMPPPGWVYLGPQPPNAVGIPPRMPMIPQGMPAYPQPFPYPPSQSYNSRTLPVARPSMTNGGGLAQPVPHRPGIFPHSSSASSISSVSYQSYPDGSRPHSRGSTTSTRSATSSIRFGQRYPMNGLRQGGKSGINGMTSLVHSDRRSTRGHSPSSITTASSSRSSRRTNSIQLAPPAPGQFPLPQRPDWAANNVPYYPSPLPLQVPQIPNGASSQTDFPPLSGPLGRNGTNAEPMQVERAKIRAGQNAWNGNSGRPTQSSSPLSSPKIQTATLSRPRTPAPSTIIQTTPVVSVMSHPSQAAQLTSSTSHLTAVVPPQVIISSEDPDFPRRIPSARPAAVLFDPSAPPQPRPTPAVAPVVAGETEIEAKLREVSISANVVIGPPKVHMAAAVSSAPTGPSYARVVRRE
ncbi:hypothetical protein TREMEDRAFT_73438 [Tremella mesenterica DSM 1558]|uniref:uncharacterized protein n=1 Tax=Tremella mesenterica (strain ATCC 24925 / CBS 8224 / DSM 1558 / NBRC 9311 / NRRL Y-6157 / RJB 2259-6 / UBC 559-6) TaxID=578456 RepID=UPI0003F49BB9|nr:uncharacterized protein TREMEDRAFT_73438 [Tremella mesenterica DSM 1558]EIW70369.1 hypothetical protein TREMEDRAFT_73438 [Tremella mesenterica DSM 1558]